MTFSKQATQTAKGVAILFMVYHHLFFDSNLSAPFGVSFWPLSAETGYRWAQLAKVCVFVFVFLSGYGIAKATQKMRTKDTPPAIADKNMRRYAAKRYVSLMAGFLFIFVLALLFASVFKGSARSLPDPAATYGTGFYGLIYLAVDALGLAFISGNPTLNPEWWYMSIAILVIFTMPSFLRWYQKSGLACVGACLVLSFWLYRLSAEGVGHLTLLPLGIAFAENDWFARYRAWRPLKGGGIAARFGSAAIRLVLAAAWFLIFLRASTIQNGFYFCQQLATPAFIYLVFEGLSAIPLLGKALAFFGQHSMNIYFTHTILMRSFGDILFGLGHAALATLVLALASLALSVLLEAVKKLVRYHKLTNFVLAKVAPIPTPVPAAK